MTPWGFAVWPYIGGELLNLASDSVVFLVLVLVFFFGQENWEGEEGERRQSQERPKGRGEKKGERQRLREEERGE